MHYAVCKELVFCSSVDRVTARLTKRSREEEQNPAIVTGEAQRQTCSHENILDSRIPTVNKQALGVQRVTAEQRIVIANSDQIRMERNKVRFRRFSAACQIANEIMSAGQTRSLHGHRMVIAWSSLIMLAL